MIAVNRKIFQLFGVLTHTSYRARAHFLITCVPSSSGQFVSDELLMRCFELLEQRCGVFDHVAINLTAMGYA
ncbi:hypothetical protein C6P91_12255 [Burkholderia multivorans]|nr:hypothetical protein WK34_10040 [Burkholderia vietnamiensis]PRE05672.1 hypothetical protein C6P91_12255 [Burkholderia multivorans]